MSSALSRSAFHSLGLVAALSLVALPASADDAARESAKAAYDRGMDAHKHGEMARAAKEFAAADAYQPSSQALQAALDAAIDADDVALGAELLERSRREAAPPGLASSITAATMKFNARAGRMKIVCPPGATCSAKVDENPVAVGRVIWLPVGPRSVNVQVDGKAVTKSVDVGADAPVEVDVGGSALTTKPGVFGADAASPTGEGTPPPRERSDGLTPVVFYAGAGVTVALAALSTYFMIHTSSIHGDFDDKQCTRNVTKACSDLADSGDSSQKTANVALVLTGIAALATAAIGIGFTNWHGDGRKSAQARPFNPFRFTF